MASITYIFDPINMRSDTFPSLMTEEKDFVACYAYDKSSFEDKFNGPVSIESHTTAPVLRKKNCLRRCLDIVRFIWQLVQTFFTCGVYPKANTKQLKITNEIFEPSEILEGSKTVHKIFHNTTTTCEAIYRKCSAKEIKDSCIISSIRYLIADVATNSDTLENLAKKCFAQFKKHVFDKVKDFKETGFMVYKHYDSQQKLVGLHLYVSGKDSDLNDQSFEITSLLNPNPIDFNNEEEVLDRLRTGFYLPTAPRLREKILKIALNAIGAKNPDDFSLPPYRHISNDGRPFIKLFDTEHKSKMFHITHEYKGTIKSIKEKDPDSSQSCTPYVDQWSWPSKIGGNINRKSFHYEHPLTKGTLDIGDQFLVESSIATT